MAGQIGYAARCECSNRTWEDVAKWHETPSSDAIRGKEIERRRRLEALVIFFVLLLLLSLKASGWAAH